MPITIGADIGMWSGGSAVNGTMNPFKWDYSDGKTWAGMGVGALAGGIGGGIGSGVIGGLSGLDAAMVGGMTAGAINGAGMTAIAGGSFSDVMGGMIKGAVVGGFTAAAGYGVFTGANQFLGRFPMHNTLSYLAGSSASHIASNTLSGQNPFSNMGDIFLDPSLLLPLFADLGPRFSSLRNKIHKNALEELRSDPNNNVKGTTLSYTELQSNGDLTLNSLAYGEINSSLKISYPKVLSWNPFRLGHGVKVVPYTMPTVWGVHSSTFIPNYQGFINSLMISR